VFGVLEIAAECIEPLGPEVFVVRDPPGRRLHRRSVEFATHHAAFLRARDQVRRLEHREVLHETGQRHCVRPCELADRQAAVARLRQLREHAAARRIRQGREHAIEVDG